MNTNPQKVVTNPSINLSQEQQEQMYELVRNIVIVMGVDFDQLTEEQQIEMTAKVLENMAMYLNNIIDSLPDEKFRKHLQMIAASGFNPKLVEKYPEVQSWMEIGMGSYIKFILNNAQ
jgi:hypothetical protein